MLLGVGRKPLLFKGVKRRLMHYNIQAYERRSRNGGLRQIIMYPIIIRVDIDSPNRQRFGKIGKLERIERLDLIVIGQLLPVPPSAERTDESNRGLEQVGLDGNEIDACHTAC